MRKVARDYPDPVYLMVEVNTELTRKPQRCPEPDTLPSQTLSALYIRTETEEYVSFSWPATPGATFVYLRGSQEGYVPTVEAGGRQFRFRHYAAAASSDSHVVIEQLVGDSWEVVKDIKHREGSVGSEFATGSSSGSIYIVVEGTIVWTHNGGQSWKVKRFDEDERSVCDIAQAVAAPTRVGVELYCQGRRRVVDLER